MPDDNDLIAAFLAKNGVTKCTTGAKALDVTDREWAKAVRDPDAARALQGNDDMGYRRWEAAVQAAHVGDRNFALSIMDGNHDKALRGK